MTAARIVRPRAVPSARELHCIPKDIIGKYLKTSSVNSLLHLQTQLRTILAIQQRISRLSASVVARGISHAMPTHTIWRTPVLVQLVVGKHLVHATTSIADALWEC